jgi:hypothetical protein
MGIGAVFGDMFTVHTVHQDFANRSPYLCDGQALQFGILHSVGFSRNVAARPLDVIRR